MKQPKKLKREYKALLSKKHLNPDNWMFLKEEEGSIVVIYKITNKRRVISKY